MIRTRMFSFFKKRVEPKGESAKLLISMIEDAPEKFAQLFEQMSPGERLMTLVAFTVFQPNLLAGVSLAHNTNQRFDIDDVIREADKAYEKSKHDEVVSRRAWWTLISACLVKFDWRSAKVNQQREVGGHIWSQLISSLDVAEGALTQNVVWSNDEKSSFLGRTPELLMQTMISVYMPKVYADTAAVRYLCAQRDLFVYSGE